MSDDLTFSSGSEVRCRPTNKIKGIITEDEECVYDTNPPTPSAVVDEKKHTLKSTLQYQPRDMPKGKFRSDFQMKTNSDAGRSGGGVDTKSQKSKKIPKLKNSKKKLAQNSKNSFLGSDSVYLDLYLLNGEFCPDSSPVIKLAYVKSLITCMTSERSSSELNVTQLPLLTLTTRLPTVVSYEATEYHISYY